MMTPELMAEATKAHDFLEAADGVAAESSAKEARLRHHGQETLLSVLEQMPQVQHVTIENGQALTDHQYVFHLSGTSGILLFRIDDGPGPPVFVTTPWTYTALDLSAIPEPRQSLPLEYQPGSVTWVMYRVKYAPPDMMLTFMQLIPRSGGQEPELLATGIASGPLGELHLEITGEGGRSVPALISLVDLSTNALYRPSGAMELAPQMTDIAGEPVASPSRPLPEAGEPFAHTIPGAQGGFYWLVPESSRMALPEGEWRVRVWKGPEYLSSSQEFEVREGRTTELVIPMKRWVNMASKGWYSGDSHIHSRLMNDQDAERLMAWMEAADLHVGNVVRMGNYARTYFEQRGFGPDYRVQKGNRALVPGQEDPRFNHGHSLALNIDKPVRDQSKYMYTDWVARETAKAGGIYGAAHVLYDGFNIRRDLVMLLPQNLTHFGEVLQIGQLGTDLYYDMLNMGFQLTAVAGSDVPFGHALGVVRYYVYTGGPVLDVDDWFAAMGAGGTFVSNGPMIELNVDGEIPGGNIGVGEGDMLSINARARSAPERDRHLTSLEIHLHGEVVHYVSGGQGVHDLVLEFEIPANFGGWLTARADCGDGTVALTSPVYFTRDGFRRWKFDEVPALLDAADDTLKGMEDELLLAIDTWESPTAPQWNFYARATAEMAPLQLEKIAEVRRLYDELRRSFEREAGLRGGTAESVREGAHD